MTLEKQDNSRPHSRPVSRTRRFFETMAITSVTSIIVGTLEDIFLAPVDSRSWLHLILYISCYTISNFLYERLRPV
ncbi:hypothetical protein BO85DRAFT_444135 [Aspergillus piperis CBS 112811]|uniref:Uncharacterized protein n=1 Tax=Aspergillus piperis CBS 112811 TaxID=1448313 RepID=A0A8G1VSC7_9EURO|nr:hypothetical protein BO85DRAFT_444135 [Aspergillus piperis CBS 112811]RAH62797.1 hypothetical protein BO85DRAFT_444135 [Aspergillus piperis CBS 112811]